MKKGRILNHDFYYAYRFSCNKCKKIYYPPEAKVYYKDLPETHGAKIVEILKLVQKEFSEKSSLKIARQLLWRFHKHFLDNPDEFYNKRDKLEGLKFLAEVKLDAPKTRQERREEFDVKKEKDTWKLHINTDKCFICFSPAQIRHHKIQLQNGGQNSYNNIVSLCRPCHADIHPWLKKQGIVSGQ